MEIPQEITKIDLPYDPEISFLGIYLKKTGTLIHKDKSTPMFIATLFTLSKIWKQPKCPSIDKWIKKMWYTYTMEYYSAIKKEWKLAIYDNMDRPSRYYAKWNKSDRERQILCNFTYMWNLKPNKWTNIKQNRNIVIDTGNKQVVAGEEWGRRRREIGEKDSKVQTSSSKINELWYEMYSVGNVVNNYVISLYGNRW